MNVGSRSFSGWVCSSKREGWHSFFFPLEELTHSFKTGSWELGTTVLAVTRIGCISLEGRRMFWMLMLLFQPNERVVRHHFPEAELIETCLGHSAPGSPWPSPVQFFLLPCWLEPVLVPEGLSLASSCCSGIFRPSPSTLPISLKPSSATSLLASR